VYPCIMSGLGQLTIVIPDELERRFRLEITRRLGGKKGDLSRAVIEALELWIGQR